VTLQCAFEHHDTGPSSPLFFTIQRLGLQRRPNDQEYQNVSIATGEPGALLASIKTVVSIKTKIVENDGKCLGRAIENKDKSTQNKESGKAFSHDNFYQFFFLSSSLQVLDKLLIA